MTTHVDGNALGGLFNELFGVEMTERRGCCDACGSVNPVGALMVFRQAPGAVVRCPVCTTVLMVVVRIGETLRIGFGSLRWMELPV
jgi:formate dehydrogenase maturation protein FdhE